MQVLCPIGSRRGVELVHRIADILGSNHRLLLLHVIDTGPRHHLEHLHGPLHHGPRGGPHREREMSAAEESGGHTALDEVLEAATGAGIIAESRLERGRPEKIIVDVAREINASLIVIRARDKRSDHPRLGPGSVGHTARFVLDHAPCDVLLVR